MPKRIIKEIAGTAREAYELHQYDKLVAQYDQHTAEQLIKHQLQQKNSSIEEFRTYCKVRNIIMNGGLDVGAAKKEAEQLASKAITQ